MNDLPAKTASGIGWIFLITGFVSLVGFLVWHFAIEDEIPLFLKFALCALAFGFVSLLISVLRQRLVAMKTDRYKDVQI